MKPSIPDLEIRAASQDDTLCLSVLAMQVFLDTYATDGIRPSIAREVVSACSQQVFEQVVTDTGSRLLVALSQDHLIGFAEIKLSAAHKLVPAGSQAELLRLYVQEPFTGATVGTQLLARAESIVAAAGVEVLWLTAWKHNQRALAFYAKHGFDDRGVAYFTFEGESHENRVLAKRIAEVN